MQNWVKYENGRRTLIFVTASPKMVTGKIPPLITQIITWIDPNIPDASANQKLHIATQKNRKKRRTTARLKATRNRNTDDSLTVT